MLKLLNLIFMALVGAWSFSQSTAQAAASTTPWPVSGFESRVVKLDSKNTVYAEIKRGLPGKATFVFVNGLVYDIQRWDTLASLLIHQGHTVIRYAFMAQPESLRLLDAKKEPPFFATGLTLKDLAGELRQVLDALSIRNKVHVVGLSYGASVAAEFAAQYQDRVEATVFISPLVIPLDSYDPSGRVLRLWLSTIRFWENAPCDFYGVLNPALCSKTDYWYDAFYNLVYQSYLSDRVKKAPAGVDEAKYKKSVFHLVRAARDFDLRGYGRKLPAVHYIVASDDDRNLKVDQDRAWNDTVDKRSFVVVNGASHALPDTSPQRTALLLNAIAEKAPETQKGQKWEVAGDR